MIETESAARAESGAARQPDAAEARDPAGETVARRSRGLGWLSVGQGLVRLLLPGGVSQLVLGRHSRRHRRTMRALGLREVAAGVGILRAPHETRWLLPRLFGDVMDLGLLAALLRARRFRGRRLAASLAGVLGLTAVDVFVTRQLARRRQLLAAREAERMHGVTRAITISRSPEELYHFLRNFQNLPAFMDNIARVEVLDEKRACCHTRAPGADQLGEPLSLTWDVVVTDDEPNRRLAWQSVPGASVPNAGEVSFRRAAGGRGTEVRLTLTYLPPSGAVGRAFGQLFPSGVAYQLDRDLRQLKQLMEVGEILRVSDEGGA